LLAISCVALLASACNKSSIKLYPVRGQVFYKNQPATGAQIVLQPQQPEAEPTDEAKAAQPLAHGTVADDGSFTLRTEHGEGAAPGKYNVLISKDGVAPKNPEQHINKLPTKYSDQSRPALVVTVKPETNNLEPFKLN